VGALSNELRALADANAELKHRLASLERPLRIAPEPPATPALDETRKYAAELLAAAEREGNSIRQRARIDGDRIIELAHQRAGDIEQQHEVVAQQLRAAQEQIAQLVRMLERRAP
jgi:cell division septum initiation protein DivIVA